MSFLWARAQICPVTVSLSTKSLASSAAAVLPDLTLLCCLLGTSSGLGPTVLEAQARGLSASDIALGAFRRGGILWGLQLAGRFASSPSPTFLQSPGQGQAVSPGGPSPRQGPWLLPHAPGTHLT